MATVWRQWCRRRLGPDGLLVAAATVEVKEGQNRERMMRQRWSAVAGVRLRCRRWRGFGYGADGVLAELRRREGEHDIERGARLKMVGLMKAKDDW